MAIEHLPPPPDSILDAGTGLVLFVGAGLSRLCGSPSWEQFADALLWKCVENGTIDHAKHALLTKLPTKTRISIAQKLHSPAGTKVVLTVDDYREILMSQRREELAIGEEIYGNLAKICRRCVTTNYDEWLDNYFSPPVSVPLGDGPLADVPMALPEPLFRPEDIDLPSLIKEHVIHLHGSLREPESMIMTTRQYLQYYRHDRGAEDNPITSFLKNLFEPDRFTVLFLGYGLEEMEMLEYVLTRVDRSDIVAPRHVLLRGFYSHEESLIPHWKSYYWEHCGVDLVPFCMDGKGHEQLRFVVAEWAKYLKHVPALPQDRMSAYQEIIDGK